MTGTGKRVPGRGLRWGVALSTAWLLVACGGDDDPEQVEASPPAATSPSTAEPGEAGSEPVASPPATPPPAGGAGPQTHVVEPGDTLSEIADRYGTTVDALVEANGIEDPDRIDPGEELRIP